MEYLARHHMALPLPALVRELTAELGLTGKLSSLFYGGEFHAATGGTLPVLSPFSGEVLAESGGASDADVGLAVAAASAGFGSWSLTSGSERAGWLRALAAALEDKRKPLMQLEAVNTGR